MSASLEEPRTHQLQAAAELADLAAPDALATRAEVETFLRRYYQHVATEDLLAREPVDLLGAALAHRELALCRPAGAASVRVTNPDRDHDGWGSNHTVVQVVTDDMPFLVDSVTADLTSRDRAVHLLVHPQLAVRRDADGRLVEVLDAPEVEPDPLQDNASSQEDASGVTRESWMHLEIDRVEDDSDRQEIARALTAVLGDVREAVEDWPLMHGACTTLAEGLRSQPPAGVAADVATTAAQLLEWLAADHFVFLGYRDYVLTDEATLDVVPGSGLGILRDVEGPTSTHLGAAASAQARDPELLVITKANARSTVHRNVPLDYIGVKTFDEQGAVTGEHRLLGLFTTTAYTESVLGIPLLRERAKTLLQKAGFRPDSHSGRDLLEVLENYPRDEMFQAPVDELLDVALEVLHLQERRKTKLFLRRDVYGRFMSCLVYLPRDRYTTAVRLKMEAILRRAFAPQPADDTTSDDGDTRVDVTSRVGEFPLARVHFVVRVPRGSTLPEVDADDLMRLESEIVEATRTWEEDLSEAVRTASGDPGEQAAARLVGLYARAFPEAYKEDFAPLDGVADLARMEALDTDEAVELDLYQEPGAPDDERRFKLIRRQPLSLTQILPMFTHLGVEVVDERPYVVHRSDGVQVHLYDFGLRAPRSSEWGAVGSLADATVEEDRERRRRLMQDAVRAVWRGDAEDDGFNALVLQAGLTWRQVVVLRTVAKYLRQTQSTFSQDYVESALVSNAGLARLLVELFETRFDPTTYGGLQPSDAQRQERADAQARITATVVAALDEVSSLDHDRIIRALHNVIAAGLRTNFYQTDDAGAPKPYLSLKLDPHEIPDLPAPRPAYEIWVCSPQVEGVHLRFGKVARGGLRWSDRREDFRTEVLGLVKAQMVKNAVIVPTGSKGGFFAKRLPDLALDRDGWLAEGVSSYRTFIRGLLDLTDNLVAGRVVPPADVLRHDGDDTYLVVAADKGTATFSDIANGLSQDHGYWLDDAFASGGSEGYDHKAMGITARGAWESVKRHFRELGVDTQAEDFTVVGVGDMSGDVFGNGMLLSEHIRLVAAFDHRHIFLDPTPDAATSFAERRRMFDLPRSSWADYDVSLISAGGGVIPRTAKSVPVTAPVLAALGLPDGTTKLTPTELIHAILLAPVDLLWNGGIGTYVKASTESNDTIGDRANDAIRVDGDQLRVRVVGEGGNLGASQLGRIEAARSGVRVNTDAIDNSAGVDTSDHEVNLKILLTGLVRDGVLTLDQRNAVLHSMTDEVAAQVLRDNYEQNVLLGNARAQEHSMLSVHQRLIHWLEERGDLDRALEFLPSDAEIERRGADGLGLTSPEFSVLVAYAKLALKHDLLPTGLPDDPWFRQTLVDYFPEPVRSRFADRLESHPLRREIVTNAVVNSMVNRGGITFAFRAGDETGASAEPIALAFVACREIFDLTSWVRQVEALDNLVPTAVQTTLYLEFRRLLDRAVRWFLTARPGTIDVAAEVARFRPTVQEYAPRIREVLRGAEQQRLDRRAAELEQVGAPPEVAVRAAGLLDLFSLLDIVEISESTGRPAQEVVGVYYTASERFGIDDMLTRVSRLPRDDRWDALARGAMRDDLYAVLDSLTRAVLAVSDDGADPDHRFEQWAQANAEAIGRARQALSGIERLDSAGIAALSVALRTLRSVLRTSTG